MNRAVGALVLTIALALAGCGDDGPSGEAGAAEGRQLATSLGCATCHSTDGERKQGPTWQGLAGSEVPLADGTTVRADRAYLARSITDPGAEVVDGFAPVMPDLSLDPDQVDALVTYIQELR